MRFTRRHLFTDKSVKLWGDIQVNAEDLRAQKLSVLLKNPSQYYVQERVTSLRLYGISPFVFLLFIATVTVTL